MPNVSRLRRRLALAQVIDGELDGPQKRRCKRYLMEHLRSSGIAVEAAAIGEEGCSFIIDGRDGSRFATALDGLNVCVKLHDRCSRVALTRSATDWPLPPLGSVLEAFDTEGVDIVHLTSDATALTVVVDETNADRVVAILSRFYRPSGHRVA